jgi:heptosyltransferase-2
MIFARKILAPLKFNLAINPRWDKDEYYASFISFFAETKWNLAYSEKVNNKKKYYNNGFDSFLTACIKNSAKIHEYEKNMNIVCFLGGNPIMDGAAFNFTLKDRMFADTILKAEEKGVKSMLIALAPGARHDRRRWPIDRYIKLGIWLCDSFNARLLVLGDKNEKWLGDAIVHSTKESTMDLIGQTTLSQACALLKQCNLFIGNDSGLLHLAASQDIPVIEISCHPINGNLLDRQSPARFGPWTSRKIILQPDVPKYPCVESCDAPNSHCIENVSIEDVQRAILSFLNKEHQLEYEN